MADNGSHEEVINEVAVPLAKGAGAGGSPRGVVRTCTQQGCDHMVTHGLDMGKAGASVGVAARAGTDSAARAAPIADERWLRTFAT